MDDLFAHGAGPETGSALYYPFIRFQNTAWLKLALLYWDRVRRIVPAWVRPDDPQEVEEARDAGCLLDTPPEDYTERAEAQYRNSFPNLRIHPDDPTALRMLVAMERAGLDQLPVHADKMTRQLRAEFEESGVARCAGEWVYLDPLVAALYMACLARCMSDAMRAPLVTDSEAYAVIDEHVAGKPVGEPSAEALSESLAFTVSVGLPSVSALAKVPMDKILRHRDHTAEQRRRFRKAVEDVVGAAARIEDEVALADYWSEQRDVVRTALEEHRRSLEELGCGHVGTLLRSSVPAAVAWGVGHWHSVDPMLASILGGCGLAAALVTSYADRRGAARRVTDGCPWHYVIAMERLGRRRDRRHVR